MRAFVAVEVPHPQVPGVRGPPASSPTHVTLKFLGEVPAERAAEFASALRPAVLPVRGFHATLSGVGAFPSNARPRVLWVGFKEGRETLSDLADRVDRALEPLGFPREEARFVPHVTLFRVRGPRDQALAERLLAAPPVGPLGEIDVREILLKESRLTPNGAVHSTLERFPLAVD
ncbi:MAG: RNA 2',3'-cyclic phosphodiesterase [Thermoplasmata archaeon]|nr:RNA 2',3'-cyclic phosphodiesterase [Thermoplasmata archaeon]